MDITSYLMGKKQGGGGSTINNQDKTVTSNGEYTADSGYTGLGTVTVNVPAPSGSISITENGTYNVTDKASAVVNVSGGVAPTTLSELGTIGNTFQSTYLDTIPNDRQTYANSITIYTPNTGRRNYLIVKKANGYSVVWSSRTWRIKDYDNVPTLFLTGIYSIAEKTTNNVFGVKFDDANTYFYSETISTLEELISKMQIANGLTYTKYTTTPRFSFSGNISEAFPYSNSIVIDQNLNLIQMGVLSYNETIEVQS